MNALIDFFDLHQRGSDRLEPGVRLARTAARIVETYSVDFRPQALLDALSADSEALLLLVEPWLERAATEYLRSVSGFPDAAREGQCTNAEQAISPAPSRNNSAPPTPSRSNLVPVTAHLRGRPGAARQKPIALVTPRAPNAPRVDASTMARVMRLKTESILASFRIGDVPLGEATPAMCRAWLKKNHRNGLFVERVIQGVPETDRIGQHIREDEAHAIWTATTKEIFNV